MSISFEVFGKENRIYECKQSWFTKDYYLKKINYFPLKVEDPLFGKRKIFQRIDGIWEQICTGPGSIISDDSFTCRSKGKYLILDQTFRTLKTNLFTEYGEVELDCYSYPE